MNAIEMRGLEKSYHHGSFCLSIPQFTVKEGYITGFVGENGAGKTTLMKLVMNMLFPDKGEVRVLGLDSRSQSDKIKQAIGYLGEHMGYQEQARARDIKTMLAQFYPHWDDGLYRRFIDRFGIDTSKVFKDLSAGQRKQFALTMALSHHPRLILLDEPTANLDPLVRQDFLDVLSGLMEQEGVTVFFSTHITSDLDKIADYVAFLHAGQLLMNEEKDAMLERHRMVRGGRDLLCEEVRQYLIGLEENEFGFSALTARPEQVYVLLGDEAVYDSPTLEEVFLAYTRKGQKGDLQ